MRDQEVLHPSHPKRTLSFPFSLTILQEDRMNLLRIEQTVLLDYNAFPVPISGGNQAPNPDHRRAQSDQTRMTREIRNLEFALPVAGDEQRGHPKIPIPVTGKKRPGHCFQDTGWL
jgi:hypothetical protein